MTDKHKMLKLIGELIEFDHKFGKEISKPNIFVAAGLLRQEVRHSSILAFLLDPNGWHGIGDSLLRYVISVASRDHSDALAIALSPLVDAVVATEVSVGDSKHGRLDILVKSKQSDLLVAIENKVDAKQGETQLSKYREWIEKHDDLKNYGRKLYVYLTLDEYDKANDDSWSKLSYLELIDRLSNVVELKADSVTGNGHVYIDQYIDLVRRHLMENDSQELINYCQNLWQNFGPLLDKVIENQPTPAIDAMKKIAGERDDEQFEYERIAMRKDRLYFMPKELTKHLSVTKLIEGGWGWPSPSYPLHFEFTIKDTKEGKQNMALLLYVGPCKHRVDLINALRKVNLKPNGRARQETEKYAKVWDARPIELEDRADSIQIEEKMRELLEKARKDEVIEKIIKAVETLNQPL